MAQYGKARANKAGDLHSIPVTHMKGRTGSHSCPDRHTLTGTHCT